MREEYKEKLAGKIARHYADLENRIMTDIVQRIKKTGEISSTVDWRINRLLILGYSSEDIEKTVKEMLGVSYQEMHELYNKVIDLEYVRNRDIYEQINAEFIPYEKNKQLQQITESLIRQTKGELENITRSLGLYLDYGNRKKVFTPLAQVYQKYLDEACMDIVSGTFDYNSVLKRVVTQLTNSGLRTIDYASGYSSRVDVAARRAVMTGVSQLSGHIADMTAEELGTEYFEVEYHMGARPTHSVWQGRVWSKVELVTVCGLGTVTGLLGANCYHSYFPFFPGISKRNWSDEWLEEQNRKENTPKEFHGKEYTAYEATQRQRKMETAMRAQREKIALLKEGGADEQEIMLAKCKYQGQLGEYAQFSKKMGLPEQMDRVYIDGRGRVTSAKRFRILKDANLNIFDKFVDRNSKNIDLKAYSQLPSSLRNSFENGLKKSHRLVRDALKTVYKDAKYYTTNGRTAEYIQGLKYVGVKKNKPPGSMAHELMHYLDDKYKLSNKKNMLDGFIADSQKTNILADPVKYIKDNYPRVQFNKSLSGEEVIVGCDGLSDIIDALTKGKKNLGTGHGVIYWQTKGTDRKEIFAQCGKIYYNNDKLTMQILQEIFPKGTFRFEKIMEGLK